ncbi:MULTISPECIES: T7SS effector LXG polymorphic toxin [Bacillus]|uniref:T7SS effector LXG polymorphic toxin n=1 Tax=Bacillus TaxID=1386 RepID=UPI000A302F13|nr:MULTISPECIES: T7SS effector LXG polymorphic toxin [Bacillus]MCU5385361.1 T7SS effector LXG polymorphic toxin [Bacillus cereus]MDA2513799.1 T7SS effector LXG polymorphic toxin [Bacillus cereus]MDF9489570.1 T7SS effector LXG polymorphic toxin [Bacillus cereus]MEB5652034.1 T7SS effector LXG polymorphic toxin [Bacillus anthracis]MEC0016762.1 T7SS effector LXG polymorphic toxin [Bacillus anthracis]
MSLNMYLGEVQSQTQSMNAICNATIQSMEQAIQSIDAFAIDTVLQGQTYSSAKAYLVQTFRPLAQGIICLCEELIRQNEAFPNDFQAKVASTDVIEHEIRQQIQEINQSIASIEAIEVLTPMPGVDAIIAVLIAMRKKLEEKLERLYEFNHSSSNNYSTALQLAASITAGLAEVQSGKGFSPVSGTFHSEKLNMEWAKQIQIIIEEKIRKSDNGIGKSVDLEHNVYNDIEGISSENQSINNRFTKEEIQATQKYLEGIKNGTIKGNIGEDFQVETDDYEMEHNIFGQPVGGRRPVLDPFLIGVAKFGFDFLFGDLFTLFDPEATYGEKLLAVGMMTPYGKGVKIVDKLHDLKKVGDVKKATSGSAGVAKGTGKVTKDVDKIDYGAYLKKNIGDPPKDMYDPHAHHIVFKKGNGKAQKELVKEGQEILKEYDIDPILGLENLVWAPNRVKGQHGIEALRNVVDNLKKVRDAGGDRDDILEMLNKLGDIAKRRK